jgi:hypothetical protein
VARRRVARKGARRPHAVFATPLEGRGWGALFAHPRELFTRLDLVCIDTTSLCFEGPGGRTLGQHGYSEDRPDLEEMNQIVSAITRVMHSEAWYY